MVDLYPGLLEKLQSGSICNLLTGKWLSESVLLGFEKGTRIDHI